MGKRYYANAKQRKVGVAILISGKADAEQGKLSGIEQCYTMIKKSTLKKDRRLLNVFNSRASNYVRQKLIKLQGEINEPPPQLETSTLLSEMNRSGRQKNQYEHS